MTGYTANIGPGNGTNSPVMEGLRYLDDATRDIAPNAAWRKEGTYFVLSDIDGPSLEAAHTALMESGVVSQLIPTTGIENGGDAYPNAARLQVSIHALQQELGRTREPRSR